MPKSQLKTEQLLEKANKLPLCPGVYIMKDKGGRVIYVGKSRKLKNRVSQYFQNSKKNTKTFNMVRSVDDFDYILCKTEIEALALENVLIKQHTPRYNIKLKDAKSYPYIKITAEKYPRIVFTRSRRVDKGKYFGPFSGTSAVFSILDTVHKTLGIPSCKRSFPRDIGKERPCIYYQIGKCCGVCTGNVSENEYKRLVGYASNILNGHSREVIDGLERQMLEFSENEQYEAAARCRDSIRSLRQLNQKQSVVASPDTNMDVFGLFSEGSVACISAMYIRDGAVIRKNDFTIGADAIMDSGSLCSFIVDHYMMNSYIPKLVVTSFDLEEGDKVDTEMFLSERAGYKVELRRPQKGKIREICENSVENAAECVKQSMIRLQKDEGALMTLTEMLSLEVVPERIEAYDISNIGNDNITAGMIVFKNGNPSKPDYRSFNIRTVVDTTDDYSSMKEALSRRIKHLKEDTRGSFSEMPDLILVDGGRGHVSAAKSVLNAEEIDIPVFGMVKDEYHKTRALCTESEEINIAREQSVFVLIYKIQDEVHRFTVGHTNNAKRRTLKHSSLEKIQGIGPSKAKKLMGAMGTLGAIKAATVDELASIDGISRSDAYNVYSYFNSIKNDKAED